MNNSAMRLSAAVSLAFIVTSPVVAAKLKLPPPTAPKDRIYSAGAIAKSLEKRGYRIEKMKRKGTTYSVTATSAKGNRVQLTVDGRSGDIVGLAVLKAEPSLAAVIAAIVKGGTGRRYVDDRHPFGIIIPDTYQSRWTVITTETWTDYSVQFVDESWSGAGYRFAVPYNTVRPGHDGYSVTTLETSEMSRPVYDVYDSSGIEISTEYSEESVEISEATEFETTYAAENEQLEDAYLDGQVGDDEVDLAEIADADVSEADEGFDEANAGIEEAGSDDVAADVEDEDTAADEAGVDDAADDDDTATVDDAAEDDDTVTADDAADDAAEDEAVSADEPDDGDSGGDDFSSEPEDDEGGDAYDDGGSDDGGDDYGDDGGGEPETSRAN
jgi:hypothetical protein